MFINASRRVKAMLKTKSRFSWRTLYRCNIITQHNPRSQTWLRHILPLPSIGRKSFVTRFSNWPLD